MDTLFDDANIALEAAAEEEASDISEETPTVDMMRAWIERNRVYKPTGAPREGRPVDYAAWGLVQEAAVRNTFALRDEGIRNVVGCGVTGFGKTRVAEMILKRLAAEEKTAVFYTHRQMLLKQTHERFVEAGIPHGVRASQMQEMFDPGAPIQLAMIQSERAAVKEAKKREYHDGSFVIWDEHHANAQGFPRELWDWHKEKGAFQLGLTATPVNLGHCDRMIYFGRPSEMRKIGAIVPATVVGPDEIDLKDVRKLRSGEFRSGDLVKKFMVQQVVGSVYDHFFELNREMRPTLGFAPDVKSAMWFCDEGWKRGVACCSIDGEKVYFGQKSHDGRRITYRGMDARDLAKELSRLGLVTVTWNRMVFAMGVDWPHLEHLIFATALGTVQFWIQACGRGLRSCGDTGKRGCVIQDHGGNWRRHPSPNKDIEWELGDTNKTVKEKKEGKEQRGEVEPPKRCPKCAKIIDEAVWLRNGKKCAFCGFSFLESVNPVWQTNGTLKKIPESSMVSGKPNPVAEAQKLWNSMYWASVNGHGTGNTFAQLRGRFNKEFGARYRVIVGKFGKNEGKTLVWDTQEKAARVLLNAPTGGSVLWDAVAKTVARTNLQSDAG